MRLTALDRIEFQKTLSDTRLVSRLIAAVVPTFVNTNFDSDTQSGYDVSSGDGTGRTVTWKVFEFYANVRNVETALKTFGQAPPGADVGDVFFSVGLRDKALMESVFNGPSAYFKIDAQRFRPTGILAAGVGQVEEWIVTCKEFHANQLAPGY